MSEEWVQKYLKAGKAVIAAKKLARELVQPGLSFLELANKCEKEVYSHNCELAFPLNISLNQIAAHYSPSIDDKTVIPDKGLLKIDCGAHFNGYIADSAITININEDPELQKYIDAAEAGLDKAIEIFKPGTKLYELGEAIFNEIISYGLKPITNLGGHELQQYDLHAGPFIPNYKDTSHSQVIKPGDAYACEPFATSGYGKVVNGKEKYIYRFVKKKTKNIPYQKQIYINKIEKHTKRLPFSPRLLHQKDLIPKAKIDSTLNWMISKGIIDEYRILIEKSRAPVSQAEHTIIIDSNGNPIVTTKE